MNHDEHLDNILDDALGEYRDAEPLAGLESRVLRRLQAPKPFGAGFWLRCGIAAAAVAVIALVIWIGMARRTPPTVDPAGDVAAQPKVVTPSRAPAIATKGPAIASGNIQIQGRTSRLPVSATAVPARNKPATAGVFPVPVPLNDAERAFASALNRHPEALRAPAADTAPVIAQIEIKPLSTTDEIPGESQ